LIDLATFYRVWALIASIMLVVLIVFEALP
jgi:hypothetical protein